MDQCVVQNDDISAIYEFLKTKTPDSWVKKALDNQEVMLIDHAHCEKKAASTALNLMYRYADKPDLLHKMSRLAREELRHFEQVLRIIEKRGFQYKSISPAKYAQHLKKALRDQDPLRLVDQLIIGAIIEARSCERFNSLVPHLDEDLSKFYQGLLACEARHFRDYLALAEKYSPEPIEQRVAELIAVENEFILSGEEQEFRFHSV